MIKIEKSSENIIAVTLYEKTTIASDQVRYLFQFTSIDTNTSSYCIATDTSDFISRYNKFTITDKSNPNPLAGEVDLNPSGEWRYYIYEQTSSTNLDPSGLTLVESGLCRVIKSQQQPTVYDSTSETYIVYRGNQI